MQIVYGDNLNISTTPVEHGKMPIQDGTNLYIVSHPVCVKQAQKAPRIPDHITLQMDDARFDQYRMCLGNELIPPAKSIPWPGSKGSCIWNRTFRDSFPVSFIFYTIKEGKTAKAGDKDARDPELSDYIRLIRVFRNGELVYRWLSHSSLEPMVLSGKHVLLVPGKALVNHYMPHLSPIDIRLIGATTQVDASLLEEEVVERRDQMLDLLSTAVNAALSSKAFADGQLAAYINDLEDKAKDLACRGRALSEPTTATGCNKINIKDKEKSKLAKLYKSMREGATADLQKLQAGAEDELKKYATDIQADADKALRGFKTNVSEYWHGKQAGQEGWADAFEKAKGTPTVRLDQIAAVRTVAELKTLAKLDAAAAAQLTKREGEFLQWLKLRASVAELGDLLKNGDEIIKSALVMVDNVTDLTAKLRSDAKAFATDDKAQALLFKDVFQSLDEASFFLQYADNPPLAPGETALPMQYSDQHQMYIFAPWYGLPIRVAGGHLDTDLNAVTLIPIIDVIGSRWQFSKSRFGDFRVALGVANVFEDVKVDVRDANGTVDGTDEKQFYRVVPHLSFSAANLKVGVGYAFGEKTLDKPVEGIRVFLGADLAKIISGRNPELPWSSQ